MSTALGSPIDWRTATIEGLRIAGIGLAASAPSLVLLGCASRLRPDTRRGLGLGIATVGHYAACFAHPVGLAWLVTVWALRSAEIRGWKLSIADYDVRYVVPFPFIFAGGITVLTYVFLPKWTIGIVAPFGLVGLFIFVIQRRGR